MSFFEIFTLKGEKKRLKYVRYETEEMMGHLQALVEDYQRKIQACTALTSAWPKKDFPQAAQQIYTFKTHVLQGHEHTKHIVAKAQELTLFLCESVKDERLLQHKRLETHMKTTLQAIIDICKSLDHLLVQEALFFQDETERIFAQRINSLVILVQQEVALYEQMHALLDELDRDNQNIREQLKHERYVEEEYGHVRDAAYPQVRDNL